MIDTSKNYVFEGNEVKLTGRTAIKNIPVRISSKSNASKNTASPIQNILIEITPVDESMDWKKWVREIDLYIIN